MRWLFVAFVFAALAGWQTSMHNYGMAVFDVCLVALYIATPFLTDRD